MRRPGVEAPRWARGGAVALVTAPGVLLAHLVTAGSAPPPVTSLVVAAVVWALAWAVARALPSGGPAVTAAAAGLAQLAGHAVLAVAVPGDAAGGGCLSVVGRGAGLLVQRSPAAAGACPPGAAPVPPGATAVLAAVLAAVLVLAAHGLLAAVTGALVSAVATVRVLAAAVLPVLRDHPAVRPPVAGVRPWRGPEPQRLEGLWRPGTPARRGPPAAVPATA